MAPTRKHSEPEVDFGDAEVLDAPATPSENERQTKPAPPSKPTPRAVAAQGYRRTVSAPLIDDRRPTAPAPADPASPAEPLNLPPAPPLPRVHLPSSSALELDLPTDFAPRAKTNIEVLPEIEPLALEPARGDAHALADRASRRPTPPTTRPDQQMRERFALGDYSGALVIAEGLAADGRGDADVEKIIRECRSQLERMYDSRLGSRKHVPVLIVPRAELKWLALDHRAGFLLSMVDGALSVEEVIDVAGMPALEVLRTLYELVNQRVIELIIPGGRVRR